MLRAIPAGNVVTTGGSPPSKRRTIAIAYLRAAQAYILISMPTDTSTIFGVFQAILSSFSNGTTFVLTDKLMCFEKFASEIFSLKRYTALQ